MEIGRTPSRRRAGRWLRIGAVATVVLLAAGDAFGVSAGQRDEFQQGTQGWGSGAANPNPPVWIASGGPGGAGDGYLRIEGNGEAGSGGNLIAFNTAQWSGDYAAAGVTAIRLDLRNLGDSDLVVRLLVESRAGGFATASAASLAAGGGWTTAVLPLSTDPASGVDPLLVLAAVTKLRILHAPTTAGAEAVLGVLGVDGVTALTGNACVDAGLPRGARALCRVYCEVLACANGGSSRACRRTAAAFERRTGQAPPCELDLDGDGIEDDVDNCPDVSNADQADVDGDAFGDACDNCPVDPNPGQEDTFGSSDVGDACECPCFTDGEAESLAHTLADDATYTEFDCVDTRVLAKPLTYVRALRIDGDACAVDTPECGLLAIEFTEDNVCQWNPPAPEPARIRQGFGRSQREACRAAIVTAAEAEGLRCN